MRGKRRNRESAQKIRKSKDTRETNLAENDTKHEHKISVYSSVDIVNDRAYLIKFFVRIRGVLTLPPKIEAPVIQIPLFSVKL